MSCAFRRCLLLATCGVWVWVRGVADVSERSAVEVVPLAPLRVEGRPARAHTQGLEVVDGQFLVTARQDDFWDLRGTLKGTLTGAARRRLGLGDAKEWGGGLAVQDWKFTGGLLLASGVATSREGSAVSRLVRMDHALEPLKPLQNLPVIPGVPLAREGMAVSGGWIQFLPEDLGPTNRLYRIRWE